MIWALEMPPSPSSRCSPGMESCGDSHRRGPSLEYGLSCKRKEKDDDLALFSEMQSRECDNFLLQPTDDFEDLLPSKPKPFADLKLGINVLDRGESSGLLNVDNDKNDYDWLLTPPDTPLFRSLDDEPAPANLVHNGRERSRPISISRSATMERNHRSRGSLSPQRLSLSPQSGSGAFRGRPSSAPHSSPITLRASSPSRKPSPPPVKSVTPPRRSSTPTLQRSSAGSSGSRGSSPVRTSSGNLASPKMRACQSNIPGLSLDAPPNLRTSLADRPASYVRGSSPASTNSASKFGRRSMSPAASRNIGRSISPAAPRSISSSHSQERDKLSSHSRGSLASSGDDDSDSLQSVPVRVSKCSTSRKGVDGFPGGKSSAFSKKPTKTSPANSAPKRSFDSAMRQMDRRSPQNMFRPLLSSVPTSTFYAGQASSVHNGMISRDSSVTTSSNTEGNDQYQDDVASDCATAPYPDIQDANDISGSEAHDIWPKLQLDEHGGDVQCGFVESNNLENTLVCSRCGCRYHPNELSENNNNICPECKQKAEFPENPASLISSEVIPNTSVPLMNFSEESNVMDPILAVRQLQIVIGTDNPRNVSDLREEITLDAKGPDSQPKDSCLEHSVMIFSEQLVAEENRSVRAAYGSPDGDKCREKPKSNIDSAEATGISVLLLKGSNYAKGPGGQPNDRCLEQSVAMVSEQLEIEENRSGHNSSHADRSPTDVHKCSKKPDSNINVAEGAGISVLILKRSSSAKGPLVHSRNLNSSSISYDDLSYTRDVSSSMMSSNGHGSISSISSVDLFSTRHPEMLVRRHSSGKGSDTSSKPQSTVSSLSGSSMQMCQGLGHFTVSHEENFEECSSNVRNIVAGEIPGSPSNHVVLLENTEPSVSKTLLDEENNYGTYVTSGENSASAMDQHTACTMLEDNSWVSVEMDEGLVLHEAYEGHEKMIDIVPNAGESTFLQCSIAEESTWTDNRVDEVEKEGDPTQCSLPTHLHPNNHAKVLSPGSRTSDHADGLVEEESTVFLVEEEESPVAVENQGGRRTRSLTLEEATDTILFCSSIIHDLAYKAASIAIEKEKENLEPFEGPRPTITIPERREDFHGTTIGRTGKTQKARKRRGETEPKPPPLTENDNRSNEPVVRNVGIPGNAATMKSPKLESKCNCTIM